MGPNLGRPFGTSFTGHWFPNVKIKTLGYCRWSLRDRTSNRYLYAYNHTTAQQGRAESRKPGSQRLERGIGICLPQRRFLICRLEPLGKRRLCPAKRDEGPEDRASESERANRRVVIGRALLAGRRLKTCDTAQRGQATTGVRPSSGAAMFALRKAWEI